ncbi:hypothetical protein C7H09_14470 [Marinobacter fuscus]|uniref:Opioid growth factor receptor (OGFr) conserved domain-containing protein n=1 Tax=Marinobacter fuscus TaxID=2109942 RepID=A0A2T1K5R1_9GAMM|nr:opioid growth factor receptor-related protein [Marinobacter fuscus]PSF05504.1 hypothetical protein C7H09_14470 [Marinobacter fuscus]
MARQTGDWQTDSALIQFMQGKGTDHRGRTLDDIISLDDFWLEHTHDVVQWLFPIPEPSRANPLAPVLTIEDRLRFKQDDILKQQQRRALDRMLDFYGLIRRDGMIEASPELNPRDHIWLKAGGHNHLRITRMIRSLYFCQQLELAKVVQQAFVSLGQDRGYVSRISLEYWRNAMP